MSETTVVKQEPKHLSVASADMKMSAVRSKVGQPDTGDMTILPSKQSQAITGEVMNEGINSNAQQSTCLPQNNISLKALTDLAVSHFANSTKATTPMSVQKGSLKKTAADTPDPHKQSRIKWLSKAAVPSATVTSNTQSKEADSVKEVTGVFQTQQNGQISALAVQRRSLVASQLSSVSTTPSSSKGAESLKPKVQAVPEFQKGKVNAKLFPPSHYDLSKVEIGSWKHQHSTDVLSLGRAKLKAIFTRRKFIYEFEIPKQGLGTAVMGFVQMACIEVPFTSVTAINIAPNQQLCEVLIEVNQPPSMFLGRKNLWAPSFNPGERAAKFDFNMPVDLTNGQLKTSPYHKITVSRCLLKKKLSNFDPRFAALLEIPIKVEPNKVLSSIPKPPTLPKKRSTTPRPKPYTAPKRQKAQEVAAGPRSCKCTSGCITNRCACAKAGGKCSQEHCGCMLCKNPFNIMAELGVDVQAAKEDKCLMQNVFKISDLRSLLREKELELPCCEITVPLKDCCIGVYQCPECGYEYSYSWCWGDLCEQECRPRNHCEICKSCGDYREEHCFKCNKCFFAGCSGFPCPCRKRGRGRLFGGIGSLFGSFF